MKRITKASVKLLNGYRDNPRIYIIGEMLASAHAIYHDQEFEVADDFLKDYTTDTALVFTDYARNIVRGMSSRFPDYIQTTFTNGNNEMKFVGDPNKLIKLIVDEEKQKGGNSGERQRAS